MDFEDLLERINEFVATKDIEFRVTDRLTDQGLSLISSSNKELNVQFNIDGVESKLSISEHKKIETAAKLLEDVDTGVLQKDNIEAYVESLDEEEINSLIQILEEVENSVD